MYTCEDARTVGAPRVGGGARALELHLPALPLAVYHLPQRDGRAIAELLFRSVGGERGDWLTWWEIDR